MIDIHCHILPGLDDGAHSLQQAVEMAKIAAEDGIDKIIATPHLYRGSFPPFDLPLIEKRCRELEISLHSVGIALKIYPGAEVHISHQILDEIKKHEKYLVLNQSSYMLLEFPSGHVFSGAKNLFFELMGMGINPIIAHPERNHSFIENPELLFDLISMGTLAQANTGSFTGVYGRKVQMTAERFLNCGLFQFISSDGHNCTRLAPRLSDMQKLVVERLGEVEADALFKLNQQSILDNKEIPYRRDPLNPNHARTSLRIKLPKFFSNRRN